MPLPISTPFWKYAPFTRLLMPFIAGILVQVYLHPSFFTGCILLIISLVWYSILSFSRLSVQFNLRTCTGVCIHILLFAAGLLLAFQHNIRNNPAWINNYYSEGNIVLVTLEEPLSEKTRSYKANASVREVIRSNGESTIVKGNVLIYFRKDSSLKNFQYGTQLIFKKSLQSIKNSGNPGSFNYQRFCDFRDISYQVFLEPGEFVELKIINQNLFKKFLFVIRHQLVEVLSKNISGEKEAGLAEALLIGYKDDLDKDLVQSYANTGVVHIIAISGLHLGLIYAMLSLLCKPLGRRAAAKWLKPVIIVSGLWLFSLAAGGSPSIVRSAVMFTCLVLGESMSRQLSIYNSLAISAFLLLCFDPYWLWDIGFQLSYTAVLSIVLFMKPIYNSLYLRNKILDVTWKLTAVTLAAQILTVPLCLYHFHQFPTFFLLTNLVAVPVSSLLLLAEILLCLICFIPAIAQWIGAAVHWVIYFLNSFIEKMDGLPLASLEGFQVTTIQLLLLYLLIGGFAAWLLLKMKTGIAVGLTALLVFACIRTYSFRQAAQQQKIIIYNIPKYQAIDFISGRKYVCRGDSLLLHNDFLHNFYLKPSRIIHRVSESNNLRQLSITRHFVHFGNTLMLLADSSLNIKPSAEKIAVDILLITKNPRLTLAQLTTAIIPRLIVMDASNPAWKIHRWKQECEKLGLSFHAVPDSGAFVLTLH